MKTKVRCRSAVSGVVFFACLGCGAGTWCPTGASGTGTPAPSQLETPQAPSKPAALSLEDRADIYMARKAYADAVDYYYRALKQRGSSSPVLWNKLGIAYQQQLNNRAARKAYHEAIRWQKDFAEPWNNMGTTYYLENKFRKSLKYYRNAITLNPNNAAFHINLGTSYSRMKKFKEAMEEFRTALDINPNILSERSALGTVVQAGATDVEFYFHVAKVFASKGRPEEAVRYLRRAFEDGFKDIKRLDDPDFQKISEYPAYVELIKNPPVAIKE